MTSAPVNLDDPISCTADWPKEAREWTRLNTLAGGNPGFKPLMIKFAYVLGVIHNLLQSAAYLLRDRNFATYVSYIPAFSLFIPGVELLGRCVKGEVNHRNPTLMPGLQWLSTPSYPACLQVNKTTPLVSTTAHTYTLEELKYLRHYVAHGQASSDYLFSTVDFELLGELIPILRDRLETYWHELKGSEVLRENLAKARVDPVSELPIGKTWFLLQGTKETGYQSITEIIDMLGGNFRFV